jgi:hypothetical protein
MYENMLILAKCPHILAHLSLKLVTRFMFGQCQKLGGGKATFEEEEKSFLDGIILRYFTSEING